MRDTPVFMSDVAIEGVCDADLAEILRDIERFWGDRDLPRYLHHPMVFLEFRDTAFVARDLGSGEIAGYLLGFVAPAGDGYMGGQGMPSCFNRWIAQAGHQVKLSGTDRLIAADSRSWE